MKIKKITVPEGSLVGDHLPAEYSDAFRAETKIYSRISPDDVMVSFWTNMPAWINFMFWLRNIIVRPFGLKRGSENNSLEELEAAIRSGGECGVVATDAKNREESVLRLDDKHLTAYISVLLGGEQGIITSVTLSTVVQIKNRLGKSYFIIVKPFHRIIVKSMLRHTLKKFQLKEG